MFSSVLQNFLLTDVSTVVSFEILIIITTCKICCRLCNNQQSLRNKTFVWTFRCWMLFGRQDSMGLYYRNLSIYLCIIVKYLTRVSIVCPSYYYWSGDTAPEKRRFWKVHDILTVKDVEKKKRRPLFGASINPS